MLLKLQKGILYGPVNSRRYGKSLGINLMPVQNKLCSFRDELPEFNDVVNELEKKLQSPLELDLITFSGNGEPTLYP